jgi:Cu/Ag efflux pump CusA
MDWMQFNMSVAVAVGFIALAGVTAETGVVMLIYLDQRARRAVSEPSRPRHGMRKLDQIGHSPARQPILEADLQHCLTLRIRDR